MDFEITYIIHKEKKIEKKNENIYKMIRCEIVNKYVE
jgi:hypothetical protein